MRTSRIATIAICLLCLAGTTAITSEAATTFNGSTIVDIDQAKRIITFQTREGQTWTLPVVDPTILKNDQVAQGAQVSIEINLSNKITKIVTLSNRSQSPAIPKP